MTQKIGTKILAILAVTAMALVPAFAMIDPADSSAESHNIDVSNLNQFKAAVNDAKAAPGDTFYINISDNLRVQESITIPENVTVNIGAWELVGFYCEDENYPTTVINYGNIVVSGEDKIAQFGVVGKGATLINKGTVNLANRAAEFSVIYGASMVNDGTFMVNTFRAVVTCSCLTNNGTITINDTDVDSCLIVQGVSRNNMATLVNTGTIEGNGDLVLSNVNVTDTGNITCILNESDNVVKNTIVYDPAKAGKTLWSEGFETKVDKNGMNDALKVLGNDKTVEGLIQGAVNSMFEGDGEAKVVSTDVSLALKSYFCDAEYPYGMTFRTAMFDLTVDTKTKVEITAPMPKEGSYAAGSTIPMETRTVTIEPTVKIMGLLRIDAYFDAANNLDRLTIDFKVGVVANTKADLRINYYDDEYHIDYKTTDYYLSTNVYLRIGLDFDGFDLMAYNPGDQWDVRAQIKIVDTHGEIAIQAVPWTTNLLDLYYDGERTEEVETMIDDLRNTGRALVDLDEIFEVLFGSAVAFGDPVSAPVSGAAVAPVGASEAVPAVSGLFGSEFLFSAKASMDENSDIVLTKCDSYDPETLDLGEVLFDVLEAEGETSVTMSSKVDGETMQGVLAGIAGIATGAGPDEVNEVLKAMGAEYSPSTMTVQEMNKMYDQKAKYIQNYTDPKHDNTVLYIAIGIVAVLAAGILLSMFVRKD